MRGGDGDGANLVQGDETEPEFYAPFEHEHHTVALFNALLHEECGRPVAVLLDVGERVRTVHALVVGPAERRFPRGFLRPGVHDVVGEIEAGGYFYFEMLPKILQ